MFKFPKGLYTDVRIEDYFQTNINFTLGELDESRIRDYKAAFIRIFDGKRWYYASTSDVENIQDEIDKLAGFAKPDPDINNNKIVKKFQVNRGRFIKFEDDDVSKISKEEKTELLKSYYPVIAEKSAVKMWRAFYLDTHSVKEFYSSKGSDLVFDNQICGFALSFNLAEGDTKFSEGYKKASNSYKDLLGKEGEISAYYDRSYEFLQKAESMEAGKYTVILSPEAAGVFAHESFGHKSEADFMLGDETMKKEWAIGTKVGSDILSIVDDGNLAGSGYVPYDDEGTKAEKTYLVKDGRLAGRLHSSVTAAELEEELTGNARSMSYEFEPIVRMTTTYIKEGEKTRKELFGEVKDGLYVETIKHGSGMSTFTIAPSLAYRIRDGKIAEPVNVSVITGNVFDTLGEIDGLSDEAELLSFVGGGCGKMEQWPLAVGFGGPYVRIRSLNVQ